ncbi:MAG: hypothetical protein A3J58_02130 [Candidatus Sungbacteria bacterium RIFCSPHIGHO2_02_FULL_52_23]|uniref:50S ribosomal protein L28 n=1 Tax=Candidatus Sungbacteria bacterium RIFCSPHIGHO2_02_FULL_52_23 TaxID=1802274 RepID=A0A1G2KU47_9BACT|nr:MAG: hypothetical protein A3J58_02130 [Candidatus Sungbacteria bacterium RIFCSPHIGHO2_02_FULL_52_23]
MNICALCDKGSVKGGKRAFLRSHYNPTSSIRKHPNLQWARMESGERKKICVKCMKKLHKTA